MKCANCGYENTDGALNCNLCGHLLTEGPAKAPHDVPTKVGPVVSPFTSAGDDADLEPLGASEGEVKFCLICHPLDPYPLTKDQPVTIGRSKDNELILPVGMVSRNHSRITWDGEAYVIIDLGSSNGTFVNQEEVTERALHHGDTISVGPYNLDFRAYRGDIDDFRVRSRRPAVTQNITRAAIDRDTSSFTGKIGEMRLEEVFQLIDFNKKTGTLEIQAGQKKGRFAFRNGEILDASFHTTKGVTAVARALVLNAGSFRFVSEDPDVPRTIHQPISNVLLDAARRLDEL